MKEKSTILETAAQKFKGRYLPIIGQMALLAGLTIALPGMAPLIPIQMLGMLMGASLVLLPLFPFGKVAALMFGMKKIDPESTATLPANPVLQKHPNLLNDIREMSDTAGIRAPVVLIADKGSFADNAAATDVGPRAHIIIGTKIAEKLSPAELKSIVAHELTHIERRDMTTFGMVSRNLHYISIYTGLLLSTTALLGGGLPGLAFCFAVMGTSSWLKGRGSRYMEHIADKGSVVLSGDRDAAISGLGAVNPKAIAEYDNGKYQRNFAKRLAYEFLSTHPHMGKRVKYLKKTFPEQKPKAA